MYGPLLFSFFTLVHAGIALLALASGIAMLGVGSFQYLPAAALCLFIVEIVTAFDNGVTVIGNRLGIGPRTERLNRMRFFLHATCIGLLVPVYTGIANTVAFAGGLASALNLAGWALAVTIILFGYYAQYRRTGPLLPVSYFGCLRYATSVSDLTRHPEYDYSAQQLAAGGSLPLASVLTTLIGLLIAALTGWFGSLWLPFVVTALMLLAGGLPRRSWGPLATSCLEVIYSGGMLYSLLYAAGQLGQ